MVMTLAYSYNDDPVYWHRTQTWDGIVFGAEALLPYMTEFANRSR